MIYDAIIIGGGVAGLSAAVRLAKQGAKVLLLEQKPYLGGRTYSFRDKRTGDIVDNGQHLMMGCYHETRAYLESIGSSHLVSLQPRLRIDFLHPHLGSASLDCWPLPAPLNVLSGLLRLRSIPLLDRFRLLRIGMELLSSSRQKEQELALLTVDQWLQQCGQTGENRKYLWDVIAIGTLNDDPKIVSALLFYRVLKAAFMGSDSDASLLIPRAGLSEILVDPAVELIRRQGGEVLANQEVDSFSFQAERTEKVRVGREVYKAGAVIAAVPYFALQPLLQKSRSRERFVAGLSGLKSSPIITVNLWFEKPVFDMEFAAVLDSNIQWIFNRTAMLSLDRKRQYLSVVISGASKEVSWSKEKLVLTTRSELERIIPGLKGVRLVHSLVLKEKRATFSPTPGSLALRPDALTETRNLFLAGDWTDTGLPATIEGAVLSGHRAAEKCFPS
ncbi:MAG: hydroxysqualene dehydroxylase HpnE [Bacteroidota bacterium]